jgi:hypothetical protein
VGPYNLTKSNEELKEDRAKAEGITGGPLEMPGKGVRSHAMINALRCDVMCRITVTVRTVTTCIRARIRCMYTGPDSFTPLCTAIRVAQISRR